MRHFGGYEVRLGELLGGAVHQHEAEREWPEHPPLARRIRECTDAIGLVEHGDPGVDRTPAAQGAIGRRHDVASVHRIRRQ
jgi:hypothetical protein